MSPARMEHLASGTGRLSPREREQLAEIQQNKTAIQGLGKRADKESANKPWKGNRAIRSWMLHGKEKGAANAPLGSPKRTGENEAVRALFFLGVDPSEGTYYVKRRK